MKKIILIGAGGHAVSCIDVIKQEKKFKSNHKRPDKQQLFRIKYRAECEKERRPYNNSEFKYNCDLYPGHEPPCPTKVSPFNL